MSRYSPEITATLCELFRIAATTPREVADINVSVSCNCDLLTVTVWNYGYSYGKLHDFEMNPILSGICYSAEEIASLVPRLKEHLATLSDSALPLAPVGTCVPCEPQMATDADGHWISKNKAV